MNVSEIPDEVRSWLLKQEKPFTIFVQPPEQLDVVSGITTPRHLWNYYKLGRIQEWLQSEEIPGWDEYEESFIIRTEDPVYSTAQIAAGLGVSRRSIYLFVRHLSMPHFRKENKLMFRLSDVISWYGEMSQEFKRRGLTSCESWRLSDEITDTET